MIRTIDDLLYFKLNFDVSSELKYQELMTYRKNKIEEEELPENLLDEAIQTVPSWEGMEEESWNLMRDSGMNWHLFVLWMECNIGSEGWDDCEVVLNTFKNMILKKSAILENIDQTDEKKLLLIDYFDKSIARELLYSYVKQTFPLSDYIAYKNQGRYEKLYDLLKIISNEEYFSYRRLIENTITLIESMSNAIDGIVINCNKIKEVIYKLKDIMDLYEDYFLTQEVEEENQEVSKEEINTLKVFNSDSKEEAYKKVSEAMEIFKKVDHHNFAIPLLRKIMRWNTKNISEILDEINTKEGATFVLTFLMD